MASAERKRRTVQEHKSSNDLQASGINGNSDPIVARRGQDRTAQRSTSRIACAKVDCQRGTRLCGIDVPGRLNSNMRPDNPASLPEPYSCAATAGVRDRKQPHTKPYMIPNAIYSQMPSQQKR